MKIYIGSDHGALNIKSKIKEHLLKKGYDVEDCGAYVFDPKDDYPDSSAATAEKVSADPENSKGIVLGGSGQGEQMTANKFPNVRCALFYGPMVAKTTVDATGRESTDPYEIMKLTRDHNNANMLSVSGRFCSIEEAIHAVDVFLETPFSNDERHVRRVGKIAAIERKLHGTN